MNIEMESIGMLLSSFFENPIGTESCNETSIPEALLGEIRMFESEITDEGWILCDGSVIPDTVDPDFFILIDNIPSLISGKQYRTPDLRFSVPFGTLDEFEIGVRGGNLNLTLSDFHVPPHSHDVPVLSDTGSSVSDIILAGEFLKLFELREVWVDPGRAHDQELKQTSYIDAQVHQLLTVPFFLK